jgi:putative hydrolase of the HAD superfamily
VFSTLLVDWGGVLTGSLRSVIEDWADEDGIDYPHYQQVVVELLGESAGLEAVVNPIHALERGELEVPHFEKLLAERLRTTHGGPILVDGLIDRMFARFEHAPDMNALVRRARQAGLKTALLSNSWGNTYPRDGWAEMFDDVVISGEVGMRKPELAIYHHAAERLGVRAAECVFVDDLPINIRGAVMAGMTGVLHRDYDQTRQELEALFGLDLS